jgi:protein-disulfide isomerase
MIKSMLRPIVLAFSIAAASAAYAAEFNDAQKKEIGEIVREYLLQNPELLRELSAALDQKEKSAEDALRKEALAANADKVFRNDAHYVAGNPKGDVTMVEFFDYNCGWCKKGMPEVVKLIDADKNLRFVLVEFPIFGEDSEYAARAALAAKKQGKYWDLHLAMLGHEGKVSAAVVDELAAAKGLDMAKLKADMADPTIAGSIAENQSLAQSLAINGTPAFIIDQTVVPGYLPQEGLMAAINEVRSGGGCKLC